ncbi:MAG: endo,4-beta-xylanase [Chthoniobacter sp.]|jgi:GH35 family endo-1,4-beta-xylanase|nr:endo,4-beta-xylanase [Chthoniobacter sp.]
MCSSESFNPGRDSRSGGLLIGVLLVALLTTSIATSAEEQDERFAALPKGTPVLESGAIEKSSFSAKAGVVSSVAVEGRPFPKAARVVTESRPAQSYQFQLRAPTSTEVRKGSQLLAVFEARAVEPQARDGVGETEFVFEEVGEPYTKSVSHKVEFSPNWQRFYIPFEAKTDYPAGRAMVIFRAGFDPQTIEIGGVQVLDFGLGFPSEKLPSTPVTYIGRDADAPWRKAAAERIEKNRKADLTITVTDADGKPVPGAKVRAKMTRHAFGWGSAVDAATLFRQDPDGDRYRQIVLANFNKVVLENDLKWQAWTAHRQRGLEAVTWLRERGVDVRGHVFVWPGKTNLPPHVIELLPQPEPLRRVILDHIADEAGALRGQLVEWDVVNEPFTNVDVQTTFSGVARDAAPDWIERHASTLAQFFHAVRQADPAVKLDINDYSILETGGKDAPHQEHYERTIRQLLADKAPLEGIGIQGHFAEPLTPIPRVWEILDRFAKFGLPIQITEFDVNTYDEALQADYTRDFLTAIFAHESVSGVLTWGFWEKRHWIPNAAHYRADWSLRPAGQVWLDLVQKRWRTDAEGVTDARGEWKVRGFQGDYEITARADTGTATAKANLRKNGAELKVIVR